jgi:hypothetical protein
MVYLGYVPEGELKRATKLEILRDYLRAFIKNKLSRGSHAGEEIRVMRAELKKNLKVNYRSDR